MVPAADAREPESVLLARLRAGDEEAFATLVRTSPPARGSGFRPFFLAVLLRTSVLSGGPKPNGLLTMPIPTVSFSVTTSRRPSEDSCSPAT
jgi:hypothetical protein